MAPASQQVIPIPLDFVNAFLIVGQRPILVDAGLAEHPQRIVEALAQHGVSPQDLALIIVTHTHGDHVGGLAAIKRLSGAPVAVHRSEADFLRRGTTVEARLRPDVAFRNVRAFPSLDPVEPEVLIDEVLDLAQYGVKGQVVHTPGHTDGSIVIILENGETLVGDLFSGGQDGEAGYSPFAFDFDMVKKSIAKVLGLDPTTLYPAHGAPCPASSVRDLIRG